MRKNLRLDELKTMYDMKEASLQELWVRRQELPRHIGRVGHWVTWNPILTQQNWKEAMKKKAEDYANWEKNAFISHQTINRRVNFPNQRERKPNCVQCSNTHSRWKPVDILNHDHFSNVKKRVLHSRLDSEGKYECDSCLETAHFKCTSDKLQIILSAEPLKCGALTGINSHSIFGHSVLSLL